MFRTVRVILLLALTACSSRLPGTAEPTEAPLPAHTATPTGLPEETPSLEVGIEPTQVPPTEEPTLATTAEQTEPVIREYSVPPGSRPHDVAPAPDGTVWYTAQGSGALGRLDPQTGETYHNPLGPGSSPHGVIVGPDGAPWITDSGLNAIVRVDPDTEAVQVFQLPGGQGNINLNTATFDNEGTLWFTGQRGFYGFLRPDSGEIQVFPAPRGAGPYGITTTPGGDVYYASLANSHIARIDTLNGEATVIEPPTPGQGARRVWSDSKGNIWVSEWNSGQVSMYDPAEAAWREWKLPGEDSRAYAVYVDEKDKVWVSDFSANALVRFNPEEETFKVFELPSPGAQVRQILGRPGEVWGAESGVDKLVVIIQTSQAASTNPPRVAGSDGFSLVISDSGTALYRKDHLNGYPDYVQVVHLDQGAAIKFLHGRVADPGSGQGVYGGDNPGFSIQSLREVWDHFSASHPNAFCITNGQFFAIHEGMIRFAFPLKVDGIIVSDGYGINEFPGQKLMLEIWPDGADITPLTRAVLLASSAPDILAGLTEEASGRRPNTRTGRTFIGVGDPDRNGKYETVLIFNSKVARKTEAASVLRSFGAEKVMMLDGGGSTQLTCQGEAYVSASRRIPQTVAILAADPPVEGNYSQNRGYASW